MHRSLAATALVMLFRPAVEGLRRAPGDADRARDLVHRFGSDTLAYFVLREDKSYFFWGDVVIAYNFSDGERTVEGFGRELTLPPYGFVVAAPQ